MRVLAVHADVIVVVSGFWQTTCTAIRSGEEGFVIDSPVLPDELEALPSVLEQSRFPVSGLLCTHADWDHLLGRLAFPEASLGTGESSANRLQAEPGDAQRELRRFDDQHYVQRPKPLALAGVQSLPVPGRVAIGEANELELYRADGHTVDGTAFWIPWLRVLVCGDYLSPVEIPMISEGGALTAYLATLGRLSPLVDQAETVIPGHGGPIPREEARRLLEEDIAYLSALERDGAAAPLPRGRVTGEQRRIHAENVTRAGPDRPGAGLLGR
jgi:glyoxylase-like metal-dependent hydrolase (beta-lactamase superfamily II)